MTSKITEESGVLHNLHSWPAQAGSHGAVKPSPYGQLCQIDGSREREREGSSISKDPFKWAKDSLSNF